MEKKIIIIIEFLFIAIFLFVIGSGLVVSPIFGDINLIDEGQFGEWITRMLRGQHLYKDIYAAYGPFYVFPTYLLAKVFGLSAFLIRFSYSFLNVLVSLLVLKMILNKLKVTLIFELLCFILLLIIPGLVLRQASGFLAIYLIFLATEKKNLVWSILAGLSLTFSFLVSSEIGIFSLLIGFLIFFFRFILEKDIKTVFKKLFIILISLSLSFFIFFVWANKEGWFFPYIQSVYDDLTIYSGIALPNGQNFPNIIALMPHSLSIFKWVKYLLSKEILLYWLFFFYFVVFFYFIARIILKKFEKTELFAVLITLYGFMLSLILIGRYGHFPFTLSPVLVLFAYLLSVLTKNLKRTKKTSEKIIYFLFIFLILFFSTRLITIYRPSFSRIIDIPKTLGKYIDNPKYVGPIAISKQQSQDIKLIQSFIFKNTKPTDKVFFFDNEPMFYLLVNRDNPTRYGVAEVANTLEKRLEVLSDLKKDKTEYIIFDKKAWDVDGISNSKRLPEVVMYIKQNYRKIELKNYTIYKLKTI